jgi:hypothetical protein
VDSRSSFTQIHLFMFFLCREGSCCHCTAARTQHFEDTRAIACHYHREKRERGKLSGRWSASAGTGTIVSSWHINHILVLSLLPLPSETGPSYPRILYGPRRCPESRIPARQNGGAPVCAPPTSRASFSCVELNKFTQARRVGTRRSRLTCPSPPAQPHQASLPASLRSVPSARRVM